MPYEAFVYVLKYELDGTPERDHGIYLTPEHAEKAGAHLKKVYDGDAPRGEPRIKAWVVQEKLRTMSSERVRWGIVTEGISRLVRSEKPWTLQYDSSSGRWLETGCQCTPSNKT